MPPNGLLKHILFTVFKKFETCTGSLPFLPGHRAVEDLVEHKVPPKLEAHEMVVRYIDGQGKARVKGGKSLKASQHYPKQSLEL